MKSFLDFLTSSLLVSILNVRGEESIGSKGDLEKMQGIEERVLKCSPGEGDSDILVRSQCISDGGRGGRGMRVDKSETVLPLLVKVSSIPRRSLPGYISRP